MLALSSADRGVDRPGLRLPDTKIVLDHCGGPVGVGRFAGKRERDVSGLEGIDPANREMRERRRQARRARDCACSAMMFHLRPEPPSSEQCAAAWRPYIETCIEAFGPNRAMFRKAISAGTKASAATR